MHPSISMSYIIPAIFLNPVIFIHGVNTILSRILPPVVAANPVRPPAYSTFGPAAVHQHVDVQSSENLCWTYTIFMICAQLVAYNNVSQRREETRESRKKTEELAQIELQGSLNRSTQYRATESIKIKNTGGFVNGTVEIYPVNNHFEAGRDFGRSDTANTSDSEIVL